MAPLPSSPPNLVHILPIRATSISSIAKLARSSSSSLLRRATESSLSSFLPIKKRQTVVAIPTTYGSLNSGPSPGTIVGIVLGSVGGFLLILWLLYSVFSFGGGGRGWGASSVTTEVVRERRGKSRTTRSRSRSRRRVSETVERVEVRRPSPMRAPPPPAAVPIERVIVEERREERTQSRPPPVRRVSSDEVVVIEEHSPPRRKSSRRSRDREAAGAYRTVDPLAYGGGNAPMREVSRKGSSRRSRG